MNKNNFLSMVWSLANQMFILLLMIGYGGADAISQTIESREPKYGEYGYTFGTPPIVYKVIDPEKKEVEVCKIIPSGQSDVRIEGAFTVPQIVNGGWTVVGIATATFTDQTLLESITLPTTLRYIGNSAFANCIRLYRVQTKDSSNANKDFVYNLPPSLDSIGEWAFYNCSPLREIRIPDSVKYIGAKAFKACTNLRDITIGKSVEHILDETFNLCHIENLTLNEGLKTIGNSAFRQDVNTNYQGALKELTIPNTVTRIGDFAFNNSTNLRSLVLGSSLESIGDAAFLSSCHLDNVIVNSKEPPTIGGNTFCYKQASFYIPEGTLQKYMNKSPWNYFTLIDQLVIKDFTVEVDGKAVHDIFTNGLIMQAGETKEIRAKTIPYVEDIQLSWITLYYSIVNCWAQDLPCEKAAIIEAEQAGTDYVTISCGGYEFSKSFKVTVLPPPTVLPDEIKLSNNTVILKKGESETITAIVLPETTTDKTVTWKSSDENVVTVDAKGNITAVAIGNATITATCGEVSATCEVSVILTPAEGISLDKSDCSLNVGETTVITATVWPGDATDKTVIWESSNPNVVTVNPNGLVSAVAVGKAIITATCGDISASCKVYVKAIDVESITADKKRVALQVGETTVITATVLPENATDKTVIWESSNTDVATVDVNGRITAVAVGYAYITASCGNQQLKITVQVMPIPATSISLDKTSITLQAGESAAISATVLPEDATYKTVTWVSSDWHVADVDTKGSIKALTLGNATITAICGEISATCKVSVVKTPATGITLDKISVALKVGETTAIAATVLPETTTDKTVFWQSSNPKVATVDTKGIIRAVGIGNATITATCGEVSSTCEVSVVKTPATGITLDKASVALKVGETTAIAATVLPETTTDKTVTWKSSDTNVATVDVNGRITGVGIGNTTITATCGDVSATCEMSVVSTPVKSISLNTSILFLGVGETAAITATVLPENATDKNVRWKSSDSDVATIDDNGTVTAVAAGGAIITASCGNVIKSCNVYVENISAESIIVDKDDISLHVGETTVITATVLPENATDKTVRWVSTEPDLVTVDSNGRITAIAVGYACIRAICQHLDRWINVQVMPIPATSITLDKTSITLQAGESAAIFATVLPEDATDKTVTWKSSDTDVATVDYKGYITAVKVGTAIITAQCGDVKAQCEVTVAPTFVSGLILEPATWVGEAGISFGINAVVLPENATIKKLEWSSSDDYIARVDQNGDVMVYNSGTCIITARTIDGSNISAECVIDSTAGIDSIFSDADTTVDVYNINGILLKARCDSNELKRLSPGMYIINNSGNIQKVVIH